MRGRTRLMLGVFAALLVVAPLGLVTVASPASGQADCPPPDPYSGGQQCPRKITLTLDLQSGPAGTRLRIRAHGFNAGDPVTGTFNGSVVFQTNAAPGRGQTAAGAPARLAVAGLQVLQRIVGQADPAVGGIDETIIVPNLAPATYPVCVSGSGAQACDSFRITEPGTSVLGTQVTRGDAVSGSASNGGTRVLGTQFARTGIAVLALVLLGVSLLLLGRFLRVVSRRRRGVHV